MSTRLIRLLFPKDDNRQYPHRLTRVNVSGRKKTTGMTRTQREENSLKDPIDTTRKTSDRDDDDDDARPLIFLRSNETQRVSFANDE